MKRNTLVHAVEACETRVLLTEVPTDEPDTWDQLQADYDAIMPTSSSDDWAADPAVMAMIETLPDAGFSLDDLTGTTAMEDTELDEVVSPYSEQMDEAAADFAATTTDTWQEAQQQTVDAQAPDGPTAAAAPEDDGSANNADDPTDIDPWLAAFFGDDQDATTNPAAADSGTIQPAPANGEGDASALPDGDSTETLPEPTVTDEFTTTTTVDGDFTTTTYVLTSSISLETGSMAEGDQADDSRWNVPEEWTSKASTIPDASEQSATESADDDGGGDGGEASDAADTDAKDESGARFKASSSITVSITTGPFIAPDGSTGTTTSMTFTATGSLVIMVSGSWSSGDEGNTGTLATAAASAAATSASSMTRAPRQLATGGNGTSVSASGEYFWYLSASMSFSVTISTTVMTDGTFGEVSVPSASFNLSLDNGSYSSDESDIMVQESTSSGSGGGAESVQVIEKNSGGSATSFALNLSTDDDSASSNASAASQVPDTGSASSADDSPLSFSSTSHNNHQRTTLYATESNHSSAYSESSSSTNADIEESSSGSTSIELSLSGFSYETTSKSKSQFSYIAESESTSDPPDSPDGTPGAASESRSLHVIETLDESESKFGFGFGSEGFDFTNEYSSNETVSDVSEHEGEWETWTLVYPELDSSAMDANYAPPPPVWVQGPNLTDGNNTNIQYNYGGDLEDGFEGSLTETHHYWMDYLNDDGTVSRYENTETIQETFPNSNAGDGSGPGAQTTDTDSSGNPATAFSDGSPPVGNGGVPTGGTIVTQPNGDQWVYDADGNLFGMIDTNGNVVWPLSWPPGFNGSPLVISQTGSTAGTPIVAFGTGLHIAIWGEYDNPRFTDYATNSAYAPYSYLNYRPQVRPLTTTLANHSVSHIIIRSGVYDDGMWSEIARILEPGGLLTISGATNGIRSIAIQIQAGRIITGWRQMILPTPSNVAVFDRYGDFAALIPGSVFSLIAGTGGPSIPVGAP
ncbi:MAG: hypothetical protein R3C59_02820 [Planctomycetaceae bacterium]